MSFDEKLYEDLKSRVAALEKTVNGYPFEQYHHSLLGSYPAIPNTYNMSLRDWSVA